MTTWFCEITSKGENVPFARESRQILCHRKNESGQKTLTSTATLTSTVSETFLY